MPNQNPDAEAALHKLGRRVREGHAIKYPTPESNLETVKDAVREQYEQEQTAERKKKTGIDASKDWDRQPPEPDHER